MVRTVERDDIVLGAILLVGAVAIGATAFDATQGFQPETEIERYCVDLAASVEANMTASVGVDSCRCIPPDQVDESQFDAPEKVRNNTELFLIECSYENGESEIFPVRRLVDNATGLNRTNTSVLNGTN